MSLSFLFISPHLDDVAFSCGGTLAACGGSGHEVTVCTIFTASVPGPQGFALACQLDKGLDGSIDYMSLRRAEDLVCGETLNIANIIHLPFREAPHRGYESAPALFAGIRDDDRVSRQIAEELQHLAGPYDFVFAPQGIGGHVDHLQTIRAVKEAGLAERALWYRDTPYAIRAGDAEPCSSARLYCDIELTLVKKIEGCSAYLTQVPFQFGGPDQLRQNLTSFHAAEARVGHCPFEYAECFYSDLRLAEEFAAVFAQTCLRPSSEP